MSTDERIKRHLEETVGHLRAPDNTEEVMRRGLARRIRTRTAAVVGVAAMVAAVISVSSGVVPGVEAPVVTQPTGPTTPATTLPVPDLAPVTSILGVLLARPEGLTAVDVSGAETIHLTSDPYYEGIAMAYQDDAGGIVFQHTTTPLPWTQGSLLHLTPGQTTPTVLAVPPEGGRLVPVGPARNGDSPVFVYLADTSSATGVAATVMTVDLGTGTTTEIMELGAYADVTAGAGLIAVVDRESPDCPTVDLYRLDGLSVPDPLDDCLGVAAAVAVSYSGNVLGVLDDSVLTEIEVGSGATRATHDVPDAYMVVAGPGGWVVRTPTETRIIDEQGSSTLPAEDVAWVTPYGHALDFAGATLGSGTGELPCVPGEVGLAAQEVPEAVAETRTRLAELAGACDYDALSALALDAETILTYGDPSVSPPSGWVAEGRLGDEPLALLGALLDTRPAQDPAGGIWVWPAVFVDEGDEASWLEVESIVGEDEIALLRQGGTGYLGMRVGIDPDARWRFYVGGD